MKNPFFQIGVLALAVLVSGEALAQARIGRVKGKVVDEDGKPIANAVITVSPGEGRGLKFATKTKKDGSYLQITTETSGPWKIIVECEGYAKGGVTDLSIPLGGDLIVQDFQLRRKISREDEQFQGATNELLEADKAAKEGKTEEAEKKLAAVAVSFTDLVAKQPDNAKAHYNLALVYNRQKQWEKAAESFSKASDLDATMVQAFIGAGVAFINAKQLPKALEILEEAYVAVPENVQVQSLLALARYNSSRYADAAVLYEKVRVAAPEDPEPNYFLGLIALNEGRLPEAVTHLEKYLTMKDKADPTSVKNAEQVVALLKSKLPATK